MTIYYDHIITTGIPRNWCQIPNMTIKYQQRKQGPNNSFVSIPRGPKEGCPPMWIGLVRICSAIWKEGTYNSFMPIVWGQIECVCPLLVALSGTTLVSERRALTTVSCPFFEAPRRGVHQTELALLGSTLVYEKRVSYNSFMSIPWGPRGGRPPPNIML